MNLNTSQIGILIAVRMKSSRLKSKALGDIVGKPVIVHLIERMKRVKNAGKIVLCTSTHPDDSILLDIADKYGIDKYAGDELDVMKRFIDAADINGLKYIVRVTGDNPLTDPVNIDRMIELHIRNRYDFTKSEYLPLGVNAEVISITTMRKAHEMAQDPSLTEYMTSYLKRPDLFKVHTVENTDSFFNGRALIRLTVDFDEDLKVMNHIYGELYKKNPDFSTEDVLEFLDKNPDILDINDNMLEIPLPKIRFKNEKEFDKKIVIIGRDMKGKNAEKIQKIRNLNEYEITGFIYFESNLQYSLIDGIPTIGDCGHIERLIIDADYFYSAFEEIYLGERFGEQLQQKGLKQVILKT
ncbi:MAG: glycosyltransferase family protein [Saprospiraceae bacterium]|jgi:spore coat polysaccharide biosynthesis protein SpsF|nr:glycosyltransferase family protein [Saprospiraceae bacterium]